MDLPDRAPSRQTGAICIRHYDEGRNPFSEAKRLMEVAEAKPLVPGKFKERFLLQHIANARTAEERKRNAAAGMQHMSTRHRSPTATENEKGLCDGVEHSELPRALSPRNHVAILEARLRLLDDELWGEAKVQQKRLADLDGSAYLDWELQCARMNKSRGWHDAMAAETDVRICGTVVPFGLITSFVSEDGTIPLNVLLKSVYNGLTDEGLEKIAQNAEKMRPLPLRFSNSRALHRYYADIVRRFGHGAKVSRRSGKPGLDKSEFCTFCRTARVMIESEAVRNFERLAVDSTSSSNGASKIMTADEFAALYNL